MKTFIQTLMTKAFPIREVKHRVVLERPEDDDYMQRVDQIAFYIVLVIVTFLAFFLFTRAVWVRMGWG